MPVQLDWEIEDIETPLPGAAPQQRLARSGCLRWMRALGVVGVVIAVGIGFLAFRVRERQQDARNELRSVVELELTALIDGDRDLFLSRQDPDDRRWRRTQEEAVDRYQTTASASPWEETPEIPRYTGRIPSVRVEGDVGWALLEVARGTQYLRELWFYTWTADDGWRHRRLDPEWLGAEQELSTAHLHFVFAERDAKQAASLAREMETWYDAVVPLFAVGPIDQTVLSVRFAYRDPYDGNVAQLRWQNSRSRVVLAPSLQQIELTPDGNVAPEMRTQLAGYLAEALIDVQTGLPAIGRLGSTVEALRSELRDWAVAQVTTDAANPGEWQVFPTPFIDGLIEREGVEVIPRLVAGLHEAQSLDQILSAAGLSPVDPATHMAFYLAAAQRALYEGDYSASLALLDPQANVSWKEAYRYEVQRRLNAAEAGYRWPVPSALEIISVVFNDRGAWVEADTIKRDVVYRQVSFFRQDGDSWLLTAPDPAYFGALRTVQTENLVIRYFERDAPWFEGTLPSELQDLLSRAAADLGLPSDGLVITLETVLNTGEGAGLEGELWLSFVSPSAAGWPVDSLDEQVMQVAIRVLGGLLVNALQGVPEGDYRYIMTYMGAFVWELERLFPGRLDIEALVGSDINRTPPATLTELWEATSAELGENDFDRLWSGYHALFRYLTEVYGPEVVPALLDNLSQTDDLDELLRLSTGQGLEQIQPAWQAWVQETYGQ